MREAVKRIVLRLFPELAGGYHLDRYARILKIADPPAAGSVCDRFRPYFAADIEILTLDGEPAEGFPKYEAVPLPVPMAGNDEGFFLWPRPGTIVTVRWIEGRPDHPVIQHVYPMGLTLPDVPDNMGKWQQREGVHQVVDPDGNWERATDKDIKDSAQNITETAAGSRTESTSGESSETVGTTKTINANTAVQVTAPEITHTANASFKVNAPAITLTGTGFTVAAPTIAIGAPGGASLLPLISTALVTINQALNTLANHSHAAFGSPPSESAAIQTASDTVSATNTTLKTLQG